MGVSIIKYPMIETQCKAPDFCYEDTYCLVVDVYHS